MTSLVDTVGNANAVTPGSSCGQDFNVQIVRGVRSIQTAETEIALLRRLTGQDNNPLLRLEFFLGRVSLFPRNQPVVVLISSAGSLEGVVYFYEKTFCGLSTGYLRGFDHLTGESSVIAAEPLRAEFLELAVNHLFLQTNARVAWATVRHAVAGPWVSRRLERHAIHFETRSMGREHRLKLGDTYTATLSRFGQHTRRNLRYYRRRAEKELNVSFHADLTPDESGEALRQLSQCSFQPFRASLAEWQKMAELLRKQPGNFAMGLSANGEWISYLVGMRTPGQTWVLVQMNHNRFPHYSLSTVLRSYFFEREIERGQTEIKFVNGTCALFQRCCEPDTCFTAFGRRGFIAFFLARCIAPWHSAPDHALNMPRWFTKSDRAQLMTITPPKG